MTKGFWMFKNIPHFKWTRRVSLGNGRELFWVLMIVHAIFPAMTSCFRVLFQNDETHALLLWLYHADHHLSGMSEVSYTVQKGSDLIVVCMIPLYLYKFFYVGFYPYIDIYTSSNLHSSACTRKRFHYKHKWISRWAWWTGINIRKKEIHSFAIN